MTAQSSLLITVGLASLGLLSFRLATASPQFQWNRSTSLSYFARAKWLLIECCVVVAFLSTVGYFFIVNNEPPAPSVFLLALCVLHIANQLLMFPPTTHRYIYHRENTLVVIIAAMTGAAAAAMNAWGILSPPIDHAGIHTGIGAVIFIVGFAIAVHSNMIACGASGINHAANGTSGLYRYLCCPVHSGVLLQWVGLVVAAWSWTSLVWLLFASSSIIPSAIAVHRWQKMTFPGFMTARHIIIPSVL